MSDEYILVDASTFPISGEMRSGMAGEIVASGVPAGLTVQ